MWRLILNVSSIFLYFYYAEQNYSDPFKPAAEQFNGSGSYGNGAGMRAHPVGLACHTLDLQQTLDHAVDVGRIYCLTLIFN